VTGVQTVLFRSTYLVRLGDARGRLVVQH
jgi:hypothetical protein